MFKNPKEYIAELFGTMLLVGIGCFAATVAMASQDDFLIPCGFALTFIGLVYCIGSVCNCHFNPLITLSMFINKRMDADDTLWYVLAQILGGIIGGIFAYFLLTQQYPDAANNVFIYPSVFGGSAQYLVGMNIIGAMIVEFVFAFILSYVVLKATDSKKIDMKAGAITGIAMFALIYIGMFATFTAVNPAKSIGTAIAMIFSDIPHHFVPLEQLWLFIIFPILGALVAAILFMILNSEDFDLNQFIEEKKQKRAEAAEAKAAAAAEAEAQEAESEEEVAEPAEEEPVAEEPVEEEIAEEEIPEIESVQEEVSDEGLPEVESVEEEVAPVESEPVPEIESEKKE